MSLSSSDKTLRTSPIYAVYTLDDVPLAVAVTTESQAINWDLPMLQPPRKPRGHWKAGLFHCCDDRMATCGLAFFLPCVAIAQIFARMGTPRYWGMVLVLVWAWLTMIAASVLFIIPLPTSSDSDDPETRERHLTGLALPIMALWGGHALSVVVIRRTIRETFNIPAVECSDCVIAWCCTPCAIAQAAVHLQSCPRGPCPFQRPNVLPAFVET
jgi:Cys-rich protein (TIGR01571 family)